ncbi:agmatinase [Thermodesulfobacteriota bacterium]
MRLNPKQFLDLDAVFSEFESAAVAILPVPYEGGVTWATGTARGPNAVIEASQHLESYDERLKTEPSRMGIVTVMPPNISSDPATMKEVIYQSSKALIQQDKFVVLIGGDHSVSSVYFKALYEKFGRLSAIQLDAHSDLRDTYNGSLFSHACVMSRIRELTSDTLQIGIRSMSSGEAERIKNENLLVCTMSDYRSGNFDVESAIKRLPDPVFITVDVDVFDWSVIRSTGTPEPGGFFWDEAVSLLRKIFMEKNVVGFDVVELSYSKDDRNSPFAVAKLIYKMLGFKLAAGVNRGLLDWPDKPRGSLFY